MSLSDQESPDDLVLDDAPLSTDDAGNHLRLPSNPATADADNVHPKSKRIACVLCRKRKLKCDSQRPSCGTCKRLAHECAYDEVRRKSGPKRGYVKQLESRLRAYTAVLSKSPTTQPLILF